MLSLTSLYVKLYLIRVLMKVSFDVRMIIRVKFESGRILWEVMLFYEPSVVYFYDYWNPIWPRILYCQVIKYFKHFNIRCY